MAILGSIKKKKKHMRADSKGTCSRQSTENQRMNLELPCKEPEGLCRAQHELKLCGRTGRAWQETAERELQKSRRGEVGRGQVPVGLLGP